MNRVQAGLEYASTLHDFLVFTGRSKATIEELMLMFPPMLMASLIQHLRRNGFATLDKTKWNSVPITHVRITKTGYTIRGFIDDT